MNHRRAILGILHNVTDTQYVDHMRQPIIDIIGAYIIHSPSVSSALLIDLSACRNLFCRENAIDFFDLYYSLDDSTYQIIYDRLISLLPLCEARSDA